MHDERVAFFYFLPLRQIQRCDSYLSITLFIFFGAAPSVHTPSLEAGEIRSNEATCREPCIIIKFLDKSESKSTKGYNNRGGEEAAATQTQGV